ncbi:MAG: CNNM domain-containing protein [Gammaproteobacteria bacterium]|nr:CNNM domain-containing protein [Gammaproteobacteria bacterium]
MTLLFIYLAIAIGVSFLCSILEAVLLSITPSYVESVSNSQPKDSKVLIHVKQRLDQSISSILILNTFAHTMGAAGVGAQASLVFGKNWETLIAILLTLTILYFSEIIPKTIGATFWRQLAIPSAHAIFWLVRLVYPLVWVSTLITRVFSKHEQNEISREEIIALASLGHKMGSLVSQENEYLANVLRLREIKTEQILTPRSVMHSLDETITVSQALEDDKTRQFSRIPLHQNNSDTISGVVSNRELFIAEREGKADSPISDFLKPITRVSESLPVQQLIDLFIKKREQLFLVEDEFGQTAGIVTLEDAIETMLGREIVDETDTIEDLQEFAKGQYRERLRQDKINKDN